MFITYLSDPRDIPQCELCGEADASVRALYAGICDDCAEAELREALEPGFGKVCASISRGANGHLTVCLAPYGIEHLHD